MTATLVKLDPEAPDPLPPEVDPDVVAVLERALQRAKEGSLYAAAVVFLMRDGCYITNYVGKESKMCDMLGRVAVLKAEIERDILKTHA